MRKLLLYGGGLIVAIIALLLIAPMFIPASAYKGQIEKQASAALGRQVTIGDDLSLSLFPGFRFAVTELEIANAPDMTAPAFAQVAEADIGVGLAPLLGGQVVIERFVLREPVINLEKNAKGEVNWELGAPAEEAAPAPSEQAGEPAPAPSGPSDLRLGDVRLINGSLTYRDATTETAYAASDINLSIGLERLAAPLTVDGDLIFEGRPVKLDARVATLKALQDGEPADLRVKATLDDATVDFEASTLGGETLAFAGDLAVDAPSVRSLMEWLGAEAPTETGFGLLKISGAVTGTETSVAFENARLAFDDIKGEGAFRADWGGERPALGGQLALEALDLRPYVPAETSGEADESGDAAPAEAGGDAAGGGLQPWDTAEIDFSGLKTVDADFDLTTGAILLPTLTINESALKTTLTNGLLTADLTRLALYEGTGKGKLTVNARGRNARIAANFDLDGVLAGPLVQDVASTDRLAGAGSARFDITTQGRNQASLIRGLNGDGGFALTDGAIRGINLANAARALGAFKEGGLSAAAAQAQSAAAQTDFANFSASFTMRNGVMTTDDVSLLNPYLRLTGGGKVNLPKQTVDLRLEPRIVGAAEGQGGQTDAEGVGAPLRIKGKLDDAKLTLDTETVVRDQVTRQLERLLDDGEEGESAAEAVGGAIIEGLFGGRDRE